MADPWSRRYNQPGLSLRYDEPGVGAFSAPNERTHPGLGCSWVLVRTSRFAPPKHTHTQGPV